MLPIIFYAKNESARIEWSIIIKRLFGNYDSNHNADPVSMEMRTSSLVRITQSF